MKHTREITRDDDSGEPEYSVHCSCGTSWDSRLTSRAAADDHQNRHLAEVDNGTWARTQAAEAAHAARMAPLNEAKAAAIMAKSDLTSAGFGVLVAQQHNGDVPAARAIYDAAVATLARTEAHLNTLLAQEVTA